MSSARWPVVTRERPCPKCGKPDRCTITPDGRAGHCFRDGVTWHDDNGASANGNGTGYVGAAHRPKPNVVPSATTDRDWKADVERLRGAVSDDHLSALASETGVPSAAWSVLLPGWASVPDLRAMR